MKLSTVGDYAVAVTNFAYNNAPTIASTSQMLRNVNKVALPIIIYASATMVAQADAGIISGIGVAAGCIGMGLVFPASLFWGAAPCYDAAMIATVNPLIP